MALDFSKSINANNLHALAKKSTESSNSATVLNIGLSDIDENENNSQIFNMDDIEALANTIKDEGFHGAIEVYRKEDGRYEIVSGHRRYRAMVLLGKKTIPCIVDELPDELTKTKRLLSSNIQTRNLTPMDWARSLESYRKVVKEQNIKGDFKKLATAFFNISEGQLYRYQCLLKLSPELQSLTESKDFPYYALRDARSLTEEQQGDLFDKIKYVLSTEESINASRIAEFISSYNEKETHKEEPVEEVVASVDEITTKNDETTDFMPAPIDIEKESVVSNISLEDVLAQEDDNKTPSKSVTFILENPSIYDDFIEINKAKGISNAEAWNMILKEYVESNK